MGLKVVHAYPRNTETVYKMFTDKTYLEKKFAAIGASNINVLTCEEQDGRFVIKSQRDMPSNPPGFAKKFLSATNTVIEDDIWDLPEGDEISGEFTVDVKGAPVKMSGTMTLKPTGNGCENHIDITTKVSIPLVGGKIASFLEGDTKKSLEDDHRFSKKYLEENY